jgi:hypothetical protein
MTSADQRECFAPWASPWLSGSQRATKLSPFRENSCFSVLARFVKGHASNQIGFYKIPTGRPGGRSHWQKPAVAMTRNRSRRYSPRSKVSRSGTSMRC